MRPRISVVIPCYNGGRFLRETLESVLGQTYAPQEVLVVDDGSTDDSAAVAESFAAPVRVIRQVNQGESVARNRGWDEATGDWIALLDADDLWLPAKLEEQVALIGPGVACVHTNYYYFGARAGVVDVSGIPPATRYSLDQLLHAGAFNSSTLLLPKRLPLRYPVWTRHGEDLIFYLDLIRLGEIRLAAEPLVGTRFHGTKQSGQPEAEVLRYESIMTWLSEHAKGLTPGQKEQIRRQRLSRLIQVARQALATGNRARHQVTHDCLARHADVAEVARYLEETAAQPPRRSIPIRLGHSLRSAGRRLRGVKRGAGRSRPRILLVHEKMGPVSELMNRLRRDLAAHYRFEVSKTGSRIRQGKYDLILAEPGTVPSGIQEANVLWIVSANEEAPRQGMVLCLSRQAWERTRGLGVLAWYAPLGFGPEQGQAKIKPRAEATLEWRIVLPFFRRAMDQAIGHGRGELETPASAGPRGLPLYEVAAPAGPIRELWRRLRAS